MQKEYRVKLEKDTKDSYVELDESVRARIRKGLEKLRGNVRHRSLIGHPNIFVLEIGQYRILYLIDENIEQKTVVFIGKHKEYEKKYEKMF